MGHLDFCLIQYVIPHACVTTILYVHTVLGALLYHYVSLYCIYVKALLQLLYEKYSTRRAT